ncbi:MAG TPA: GNAT family N-acetyltransferase [Bryobacteraceae bacterium]|nr:GNAT family N-acetyltransferase [Bryobacteraceae bacterium]
MRQFEAGDLEDVLAIERDSFGPEAWDKRLFLDYFRKYPELFFVARVGRRTVGYSITCAGLRSAELVSIAVLAGDRRQGVARALLGHTATELCDRRVKTWWLMVDVANLPAIRFYEAYGFVQAKRVKQYYSAGRDAWRMRLAL